MKKIYLLIICIMVTIGAVTAQTWNGSVSTDWNTAGNWTGGVPVAAGNVTIPGAAPRYPLLASNVTINSIDMQAGSQLDVNGFSLTLSGAAGGNNNFTGATLNNSNAGTDIAINFNGNGADININGNTINDNISFTFTGTSRLLEAQSAANHYIGNTSFTGTSSAQFFISNLFKSVFDGNLSISRTGAAGTTAVFGASGTVAGNFSLTNNVGGAIGLGNLTPGGKIDIGGTINITVNHAFNDGFTMYQLVNQTNGGTISVQSPGDFDIQSDTLKVTSLSVSGHKNTDNNSFARLFNNSINGNVSIADDAANTVAGDTRIRGNIITGNSSFTNNGSNQFLESDIPGSGNTHTGNATYIRTGTGSMNIGAGAIVSITQNLTLNSTAGISLGKIKFNGSTDGIIEQLGTQASSINELTMEKTGTGKITLNSPVTVTNLLTFNGGKIFSTATNNLIFSDNATHTGASDAGYVDGPVLKTGDDIFTFPVGQQNKYAPISITAPANNTDEFRAQYIKASPNSAGYTSSLHDPTINHISNQEYWLLDRGSIIIAGSPNAVTSSDVKVTLSWDAARSGGVTSMPDLRVARWNGSTWKDEGNSGTTGTNANGTVQSLTVTSFSPFTLSSSSLLNPLPLTLLNFAGSKCNSGVCLLWTTENEINFSHFEVEKSNNGISFSHLTDVSSRNLTERTTYTSKDVTPASSANYYRLKIINTDGSFTYSRIVKIDLAKPITVLVQPNPASDVVYIKGTDGYQQIKIIDMAGKLRLQKNIQNSIEEINISNLPAGIYMIQVINEKETTTIKLVKQ